MLKKILPSGWLGPPSTSPPGGGLEHSSSCIEDNEEGSTAESGGGIHPRAHTLGSSKPISIRQKSKKRYKSFRMLRMTPAEDEASALNIPESMPDVEIIEMSQEEKQILRESWKVVYSEVSVRLFFFEIMLIYLFILQ